MHPGSGKGTIYRIVWKHADTDQVIEGVVFCKSVEGVRGIAREMSRLRPELTPVVEEVQVINPSEQAWRSEKGAVSRVPETGKARPDQEAGGASEDDSSP
jgi:hypothetical protein